MKLVGLDVVAIRPPTTPPRPMPRFRVTRWSAKAACRLAGGVRPARRADWLGQKPAFPTPGDRAARKACHGSWMSGKLPNPIARRTSAAASVARPPIRSTTTPTAGPRAG